MRSLMKRPLVVLIETVVAAAMLGRVRWWRG